MVMVVVVPPLVPAGICGGVYLGDDQLRAVFGSLPVVAAVAVLTGLVELLPRLAVVPVQSAARFRRRRIDRCDRVAVS